MKNYFLSFSLPLALLACLFFATCASTETRETLGADISGDWILSSIKYDPSRHNGYAEAQQYIDNLKASGKSLGIIFSADRSGKGNFAVYGFSGVNSYSGFVSLTGERFMENPPAATLVAGNAMAEQFERLFLSELYNVSSVSLLDNGATLALSGDDELSEMIFERFSLNGKTWRLSAYTNGRELNYIQSFVDVPTIVFGDSESFSGTTSVNRIKGTYATEQRSRALSFSKIASTKAAPADAKRAEIEAAVLQSLERTSSYRLSGSSITFLSDKGESLLVFYFVR